MAPAPLTWDAMDVAGDVDTDTDMDADADADADAGMFVPLLARMLASGP